MGGYIGIIWGITIGVIKWVPGVYQGALAVALVGIYVVAPVEGRGELLLRSLEMKTSRMFSRPYSG